MTERTPFRTPPHVRAYTRALGSKLSKLPLESPSAAQLRRRVLKSRPTGPPDSIRGNPIDVTDSLRDGLPQHPRHCELWELSRLPISSF